jgi:hypothetical protein
MPLILTAADINRQHNDAIATLTEAQQAVLSQQFHILLGSKREILDEHDLGRKRDEDGSVADRYDDELDSALAELKIALRRRSISEFH